MATKATAKLRGSEKLLDKGLFEPKTLTKKQLGQFTKIAQLQGVKLYDWCTLGQPGIDGLCGKYQVSPEVALDVIKKLITIRDFRVQFEYFPRGIPVPGIDGGTINFRAGSVSGVIITDG